MPSMMKHNSRLSFFNSRAGLSQPPFLRVQFNFDLEDRKVFKAFHIWKKINLRLLGKQALLYETGSIDFCFQDELQLWRRNHLHAIWKETRISSFCNYNHHHHHTFIPSLNTHLKVKMHLPLCPLTMSI